MSADWYTKAILTVIGAALVAIAIQQAIPRSLAQGIECPKHAPCVIDFAWRSQLGEAFCGTSQRNPCYVVVQQR